MFGDARQVDEGALLETDLCVVGAGAAGIALALELAGGRHRVLVLESGGLEPDPQTQGLYAGEVVPGLFPPDRYPVASRIRYFGGSTNVWGGLCAALDPIDFEHRPWIPHSGWPFHKALLDPYYDRATSLVSIRPWDDDAARLSGDTGGALDLGDGIRTKVFHLSPPTRFGAAYRAPLERAANVQVLLHANAVEIRSDESEARVEWVQAATLSGRRFRVRARAVVLATGGLENPRLLLNSNHVRPAGLGNRDDLVGRFFMEHLHHPSHPGRIVIAAPRRSLGLYVEPRFDPALGHARVALFALSDAIQRRHRLPNHGFGRLDPLDAAESTDLDRAVGSVSADLARAAGSAGAGRTEALLGLTCELLPDPDNRVTLSDERDRLGLRRLRLRWDVTERDRRGQRRALETFARELGRSLRGRARVDLVASEGWPRFAMSNHHLGTTRMHAHPRRGVVDPNCRVHGIENLYVAGSSVFPTGGQANPTLTLLALALRLADHLKERLA